MEHLLSLLRDQATQVMKSCFDKEKIVSCFPAEITPTNREKFGHYQCNSPLKVGTISKKNPRLVAGQMVEVWKHLEQGRDMIEKWEIAGPGFINVTLSRSFLSDWVNTILQDDKLGVGTLSRKQKIVIDFSSPNVAKELHVGHLRSTIIGDSLARLFEFLGHEVLRLNHVGDWGTQFGMLIAYLREDDPGLKSNLGEKTDLLSLMEWYRASKKRFDSDPPFKKRAQNQVIELQRGEEVAFAAWKKICAISRRGFQEIYDFLNVKLIERGESFYNEGLPRVVKEFEKSGLVELSAGAKCLFLEGFTSKEGKPLPLIIEKSDGGYNYETTDLAALRQRVLEERADRIIYVTDAGQQLHFQMVFKAARQIGYYKPEEVLIEHVPFGVVLGPDGKKFKTRSGNTERLINLLQKAVSHAKKILEDRMKETSSEEIEELAYILGVNAVKYADLSGHRGKDYLFSYERMLKFEGNTAAFLLYAYVRIQGIKRKVEKRASLAKEPIALIHPTEISLGLHLCRFSETLELMDRTLLPHRLCDYLYELAEKFHAFFRDCRVEGSKEQGSRLALCELTAKVLKTGLHLLGLRTMSKM